MGEERERERGRVQCFCPAVRLFNCYSQMALQPMHMPCLHSENGVWHGTKQMFLIRRNSPLPFAQTPGWGEGVSEVWGCAGGRGVVCSCNNLFMLSFFSRGYAATAQCLALVCVVLCCCVASECLFEGICVATSPRQHAREWVVSVSFPADNP